MEKLEQEILISMIDYPDDLDDFLQIAPPACFSKKGQVVLQIINTLSEANALSKSSVLSKLTEAQKEDDYILSLFATQSYSNYLNLAQEFIKTYKLKTQRENALKLLQASDNKELIDLSTLDKSIGANEYKTLAQWIDYYKDRPSAQKFKTGVAFLDSVFDGGIEGAQLVLISGDPEAGKTTLGLQILENISHRGKVCFFSFEFTIEQYIQAKIKEKRPPSLENLIIINDGYELYMVAQHIKNLYKQGVRVFLIDSQMRLTSPMGRNMEEEESLKFSLLAKLCHSLGIVIFLIVQTSKSDRDNPMGSKKGGHEASIIIRLEHCKPELESLREFSETERLVIIKKNKQTGKHFKEKVAYNPEARKFASLDSTPKEPSEVISMDKISEIIKI